MKRSSHWFSAIRLIFCCSIVSLALSTSVGASGAGTPNAGNPHQEIDLRKESGSSYDSTSTYEQTKFNEAPNAGSSNKSNFASTEQELKANQSQLRDALKKQMTTLLQENAEINRQRLQILESSKQRLLWAQVLVGILVICILSALAYFWHLHASNLVNRGMNAISNTLSNFQDSLLQFVDTSDLAASSSVSSFSLAQSAHQELQAKRETPALEKTPDRPKEEIQLESSVGQTTELDTPERRRLALSAQRSTNISRDYFVEELELYQLDQLKTEITRATVTEQTENHLDEAESKVVSIQTPSPQKPDEFFAVKGYVDSWLRVYKPSEQSNDEIRLTPTDPLIELAKKEAEQEDSLAFDRDANKMQARSARHKPLSFKSQALQVETEKQVTPVAGQQDKKEETQRPEAPLVATATEAHIDTPSLPSPASSKRKPSSPRELLTQLDHCRANNDAEAYQRVYREIKKLFNLKLEPWEMLGTIEQKQLSDFPHVINKILELWASDEIVAYLERLLGNSRINPRQGFDLAIYEKLEDLLQLAKNPERPRDLQHLKKLEQAAFLFSEATKVSSSASKSPTTKTALQIDASLSYQSAVFKSPNATLEAMITPSLGALDVVDKVDQDVSVSKLPIDAPEQVLSTLEHQNMQQTQGQAPGADHARKEGQQEDKFMLSPFEVRIKLAVAYTEMGDHEGAILLLEEVIQDAPVNQRKHAERLIREIEAKKTELADSMISHAAQNVEPVAR